MAAFVPGHLSAGQRMSGSACCAPDANVQQVFYLRFSQADLNALAQQHLQLMEALQREQARQAAALQVRTHHGCGLPPTQKLIAAISEAGLGLCVRARGARMHVSVCEASIQPASSIVFGAPSMRSKAARRMPASDSAWLHVACAVCASVHLPHPARLHRLLRCP
jgi:hypothetical protein